MTDSYPRPPRDDAEREACVISADGRDLCMLNIVDENGNEWSCTRDNGHAGDHVAAFLDGCAEPICARQLAAPEASTPEPAGTKHHCATCERVRCPDCMAPAPVAAVEARAPETPKVHDLKTWPKPFAAILDGSKRYEIRKDDRNFKVGDTLRLREWAPEMDGAPPWGKYTGREVAVTVTHKTRGGEWDLPDDICVLSIAPLMPAPVAAPAPEVRALVERLVEGLHADGCERCGLPDCRWRTLRKAKKFTGFIEAYHECVARAVDWRSKFFALAAACGSKAQP